MFDCLNDWHVMVTKFKTTATYTYLVFKIRLKSDYYYYALQ